MKLRVMFLVTIILLVSSSVGFATDEIDWQSINTGEVSPSEMHKMLGQQKARNLDKARQADLLALRDAETNTQTNFDVTFYDIFMRIDDTTEIIYGAIGTTALAAEDGVAEIQIDLHSTMTVDSIINSTYGLLTYNHIGDVVTITLPITYNTGEVFDFKIYYSGHPVEGGLLAFAFHYYDGEYYMTSLSEPYYARTWWPCKDRMDDKADSFNIAVQVDDYFYVGSNGTLDSTVLGSGNTQIFYYSVRYPMATYLFSIAASLYTVWYDEWVYNNDLDTMPIVHAVNPAALADSEELFDITPQALDILSDKFGLYPFADEKYGHASFLWGGAMEHQTMTSFWAFPNSFWEYIVVHELGHQWFGDMITCESWHDIWLNEGWASYSEALYYEEVNGWNAYHNYMMGMAYYGGGTVYVDDTTDSGRIFDGDLSYDKGAWVVHMLRGVLGDSVFYEAIDAYYNSEFKYGSATTEDFITVFENSSGLELSWFFDDWIYGEYYPSYNYSTWQEPSDTGGYDLFLKVEQINSNIFEMPIEFVFEHQFQPSDTIRLTSNQDQVFFRLNFADSVTNVQFDPRDWILKAVSPKDWTFEVFTEDGPLNAGEVGLAYYDTIEFRSVEPITSAELLGGSLPPGLTLNIDGTMTGYPTTEGDYDFICWFKTGTTLNSGALFYSVHIEPGSMLAGDLNLDMSLDVSDIVFFVDYMFNEGPPPSIMAVADVDNNCEIDISDLVLLIDYFFNEGSAPVIGCAE